MSVYQLAQREGQEVVRAAILDAATRLLVSEGAAALTVRRIAAEVGCSTKVIYTLFGGKDGLVEALWLEGFARFERRLSAELDTGDPRERLLRLGGVYRAYALEESDYYRVMFLGAVPGFTPSSEAVTAAKRTFQILVDCVAACLDCGALTGGAAEEIADLLWMAVHGASSLEISGYFEPPVAERRYQRLLLSVITPFLPDERNPS
ncbi:TetR/AcrR family transcriptional regulator [Nonomuraea sediminis]|uniref:TetR/AcrR family transcriptional regulator n=1 Tax=Nonomuraea sediminis TaxID=2835864 RepID=UPI001BDC0ACE|nr:TetR/AcrR family transcriptional regulator [Nonomuraea sediminis]